jgi:hypothetical protein
MKRFLVFYFDNDNDLLIEKEKIVEAVTIETAMLVFKNENNDYDRITGINELIEYQNA